MSDEVEMTDETGIIPAPPDVDEMESRVEEVVALIAKGLNQREVVRYLNEKTEWGKELSRRHLRRYVAKAREQLVTEAQTIDKRFYLMRFLRRMDMLFQASFKVQDYKTAISAERETARVLDLGRGDVSIAWEQAAAEAFNIPADELKGMSASDLFERLLSQHVEDATFEEIEND